MYVKSRMSHRHHVSVIAFPLHPTTVIYFTFHKETTVPLYVLCQLYFRAILIEIMSVGTPLSRLVLPSLPNLQQPLCRFQLLLRNRKYMNCAAGVSFHIAHQQLHNCLCIVATSREFHRCQRDGNARRGMPDNYLSTAYTARISNRSLPISTSFSSSPAVQLFICAKSWPRGPSMLCSPRHTIWRALASHTYAVS